MTDRSFLFTSESVTEGHPDKMADQISDSVLDAVLAGDPEQGRVACETLITTGLVVVAGEITTDVYVDIPSIVRRKVREIGYDRAKYGFDAETCGVMVAIDEQSADIAQGVDQSYEVQHDPGDDDPLDRVGAGDQGMMFGYATDETDELMPLPITLAHRICKRLAEVRKADVLPYLRPDGKSQVTIRYETDEHGHLRPVEIVRVLISTQHRDGLDADTLIKPDLAEHVLRPILPGHLYDEKRLLGDKDFFYCNPTGKFVDRRADGRHRAHRPEDHRRHLRRHGPPRRRRVLGQGPDQGRPLGRLRGALRREERRRRRARRAAASSRSPTRSASRTRSRSRSTASAPNVDGSTTDRIANAVREHFDLRPAAIIRDLDLRRPIYAKTAAYGHFGRDDHDFTWERTDKADALRPAAGVGGRLRLRPPDEQTRRPRARRPRARRRSAQR